MSNWIKPGLSVVNITNLDTVYVVEKIVYKSKKVVIDNETIRKNKIQGVEVKRIVDNVVCKELMHTKELIPLTIASKGKMECYAFINKEGIYKDY